MATVGNEHVERYLWNGNKSKIVSSGLLNTSALSSNATLLAILLKQESLNAYSKVALCLVISSVILQVITGIILALEYRSTLSCEKENGLLTRKKNRGKRRNKESNGTQDIEMAPNGNPCPHDQDHPEYLFCWARPMQYQFISIILLMFLNVINTFVVAFAANIDIPN